MARSQETFNKKEVRSKKEKKRKEKEKKRLERRENAKEGKSFDDMIAYVDENGNITATPPDPETRRKINVDDIEISVPKRHPGETENTLRKGVVTFFNASKGFGFIRDTESQQDIFVHIHDAIDDIDENNAVTFEIERGPKGLKAVNVRQDR
ncbi:MAG: cold shock domain-containing protein [Bacteroidales bacterium]|nr:cold shock domain-containing protein [Bacteroidales bacterium]